MQVLEISLALYALIICGRCYLFHPDIPVIHVGTSGCLEDCNHHGQCETKHFVIHECKCNHGYSGSTCKYEDICVLKNPCQHGGRCEHNFGGFFHDHHSSYECHCQHGFYGTHCEYQDPCVSTQPCQHGGQCEFQEHTGLSLFGHRHYVCHCQQGYKGIDCEYTDPCVLQQPCQNGGTCAFHYREHSEHHHYTCDCPQGTSGHDCEVVTPAPNTVTQSIVQTSTVVKKASTTTVAPTTKTPLPTTTTPLPITATKLPSTSTTAPVKTTTTTQTPASTNIPLTTSKRYTCVTMKTITDLANNVTENNAGASSCNHGDNAGSEALVLNNCDVQQPASWVPGSSVVAGCSSLSVYTPIATFTGGAFHPGTDISAIFLGCLGDQIRVGLQTCDGGTRIEHLSTGDAGNMDASLYHVIQ